MNFDSPVYLWILSAAQGLFSIGAPPVVGDAPINCVFPNPPSQGIFCGHNMAARELAVVPRYAGLQ